MTLPLPFQVAQHTGNNLAKGFKDVREENAIERILSESMQSNDPAVLQQSIGKILSQVSPERQGAAIKYLEGAYNNVLQKQAAQQGGYSYGAPPAVQAAQYRENAKNKRLEAANNIFNGGAQPSQPPQPPQPLQSPATGQAPIDDAQTNPQQTSNNINARRKELLSLTGHPDREIAERAKAELRSLEAIEKQDRADLRERRKETQKTREGIAQKADIARQGIREKEHLIELIDTGKLNDPTYAQVLDNIPMKLGQRFLSPETVEYKAGLINGYRDLRNIFTGATRVKEIELLEDKVADIYLTDQQKKAILKSSLQTLQYDIIRADAAAQVEKKYPNLGVLEFSKKVDEIAKPKIDALANRIIDEQNHFIADAENRKKIPLDYDDPEGRQILDQIFRDAGGNKEKARQIAKQKGYIIGK